MLNNFTATARVVADPEIKEAGSTTIGTMRVVNSTNKKKNGEWVENPFFFRVVSFGQSTERLKQFKKGDLIVVTGELVCEKYGNDGKLTFNLNVNKIEPVSPKPKKDDEYGSDDLNLDDDMPL